MLLEKLNTILAKFLRIFEPDFSSTKENSNDFGCQNISKNRRLRNAEKPTLNSKIKSFQFLVKLIKKFTFLIEKRNFCKKDHKSYL